MFLSTPITSLVVAAHMLLHAALGCCWHHAHSCEANCYEHPSAVAVASSCDRHDGHAHWGHATHQHHAQSEPVQEESPQDRPAPQHRCEGQTCVFIGNDGPMDDGLTFGADARWLTAPEVQPAIVLSNQVRGPDQVPTALPPPLRPHLYLQILLI